MGDILFYIIVGLELLGALGFSIYKVLREKNNVVVKQRYIWISFGVFAALDGGLMFVYGFRSISSQVWDLIFIIGVYVFHVALLLVYLYIISVKVCFDGNTLIRKNIFSKTLIELTEIQDVRMEKDELIVVGNNKRITLNPNYFQNSQIIFENLDLNTKEKSKTNKRVKSEAKKS